MAPIAQGQGFMVGKPYSKAYTFFSQTPRKKTQGLFILLCLAASFCLTSSPPVASPQICSPWDIKCNPQYDPKTTVTQSQAWAIGCKKADLESL